ncbi:MAG: SAM-dependent methyltransferase [Epulopiscium sp. Nele67-Bin005]|nr:MAG: SAM-dependent methyltransferase [Epulopiscium sp. Nele67-Bin005]
MKNFISLCQEIFKQQQLISGIWSSPRNKNSPTKITVVPLKLNEKYLWQFEVFENNQAKHFNLAQENLEQFLETHCTMFKQIQIYTTQHDYHALINKKGDINLKRKNPSKEQPLTLEHNRKKNYLLDEESAKEFLIQLGLMSENGEIKPSKYDKYKQINKYLEMIEPVIAKLDQPFYRIIDFGCGKSYLTFAMYYYLTFICKKEVEIIGLDLKADVILFCNKLTSKLGYKNLFFQVGDIGKFTTNKEIDIVVSLHACNTATDAALAKAVGWNAKAILAVPCCHNECYKQIKSDSWKILLQHGILKEKIASLITDGLRAQLLETVGYSVSVVEFIDTQHTPKNILIRATLNKHEFNKKAYISYRDVSENLGLELTLEKMLIAQGNINKRSV